MHRSRIGLAAAILALVATVAYLGVTLNTASAQLEETSAELDATATTLTQQEAANDALLEETTATLRSLTQQEAANAALERTNSTLRSENTNLQGSLAVANAQNAALQSGLDDLGERYNQLDADHASLTDQHDELSDTHEALNVLYVELEEDQNALAVRHSGLLGDFTTLSTDHQTLSTELDALKGQYRTLAEKAGELDQVEERISELEGEIERLVAMRLPLILGDGDLERGGVACTGSMEPVLTCLDEVTWLQDFDPADIVVGSTIGFYPACWESDRGIAHRVMDIDVRDGVRYFWPKGDANPEPDGCWVPETNVRGYIVEIHKNVNPENAELREAVLSAKGTYEQALDAYYALRDRYCARNAVQCTVPRSVYGQILQLHQDAVRALSLYRCWSKNARDSEYPGHIPYDCT